MSNNKNEETKSLFAGLEQYKKKNKKDVKEDISENVNIDDASNSENIYMSLLEENNDKEEYKSATHYFRKDQLKDLDKFSKKTNKLKNEFMRELMDLVFDELTRGLKENKVKEITEDEINVKDNITNNSNSEANKTAPSDSPFGSLLEVNDSKDQYVRATHYFRPDQLEDLDKFVEKSGKSKNEFVRDTIDLVFSQLKEVSS